MVKPKCPSCRSSKYEEVDKEWFCQRCGYIHSDKKDMRMVTY